MSELTETLRSILHKKENICTELKQLANIGSTDYKANIDRLTKAYSEAGELPAEYAELLDKKFAEAVKTALAGEAVFLANQEKLAKLAVETDVLIAAGELATLKEVEKLESAISELSPGSELLLKLQPLKSQLAAEEMAVKAAENAAIALAEELNRLCAADEIAPLHDRKSGIEAEFAQLANIPRHAAQRYNDAHRRASVKLAQHYETIDLARWEAYTRKLDLCSELEKLLAAGEETMPEASKKLNAMREQWKNLGSVPKEKSDEINPRYIDLTRKLQHRIDEFFARKRQAQKIACAEKEQLCADSEALAESTDWKNTAEKMRDLQNKWKTLPRAGTKENELFQRFRAAQDKFFNARKAAFEERDKKFNHSAETKKSLITEAENLSDPRRARQLREAFRNAGFAGKQDQELYLQFNSAMDKFFNAKKAEYAIKEERAVALVAEAETLISDPLSGLNRFREIREELCSLNCRETHQQEQQIFRRFDNALNESRRAEQRRREENSDSIAMTLALVYDAWKKGDAPVVPEMEMFAGFSKLQQAAKLLIEAMAGDEKSALKLDKHISAAMGDRERICADMEKLAGKSSADSATSDLAAELQFAMLGDFGKSRSEVSKAVDPHKLCAEFAAAGLVPAEELQNFQKRFTEAKMVIFQAK